MAEINSKLMDLIRSLAEHAASEDYLAAQASAGAAPSDQRTKPVPLPATDRAA